MTTRSKLTAISAVLAASSLYLAAPASAEPLETQRIIVAQADTGGNTGNDGNTANGNGSTQDSDGGFTGPKAEFKRLDVNQDGFIDAAEMRGQATLNSNRQGYDVNNDGRISADEYDAYHSGSSGAHLPAGNSTITAPR